MTQEARAGGPPLVILAAGRATRYGGIKPLAPVGVAGEAVIDLLASDALDAGFARILLVVGPSTAAPVRYHVERSWPRGVDVAFAHQRSPRGTVDAVLAASTLLDGDQAFGIANADDLPGREALATLASHLRTVTSNIAVCFRLRDSLLGEAPVTRGLCTLGSDGLLHKVDERRQVAAGPDGRIVAGDGREPTVLDPDAPVSMNLWGFRHEVLEVFGEVMHEAGADGPEVLLPELVDDVLGGRRRADALATIHAVVAAGRCIGVTHQGDVARVQAALAREIGRGERPAQLWTGTVAPLP